MVVLLNFVFSGMRDDRTIGLAKGGGCERHNWGQLSCQASSAVTASKRAGRAGFDPRMTDLKVELDRLLPADGHLDGRDYEARITFDETGKSISFGYSGLASAVGPIRLPKYRNPDGVRQTWYA